jgi:predicted nucleic acid-binding protein
VSEAIVDANILLRYLTDEPRELADRASNILDRARSHRIALLVTSVTLAEVVCVLESVYGWERETIADGLTDLLSADILKFPEEEILIQTLAWYRGIPSLHFADAYVAATAMAREHGTVLSFDRGLKRISHVTVIEHAEDLT